MKPPIELDLHAHSRLKGEYRVEIKKPDGTVHSTGWMENIITNVGLDQLGGGGNGQFSIYAHVGTGTSVPTALQTQLDARIGTPASASGSAYANAGSPTYAGTTTWTYAFAQGSIVGNITELGIGPNVGGTLLRSRALITDGGGVPTALSVVALDQLTVFYRLKITPPLADAVGSVVIGGTNYNYTARLAQAGIFANGTAPFSTIGSATSAWLSTNTALLATTSTGINNVNGFAVVTPQAYVTGSFARSTKCTWGPSVGNGSSRSMGVAFCDGSIQYQYLFDQNIVKNNTQQLEITLSASWSGA